MPGLRRRDTLTIMKFIISVYQVIPLLKMVDGWQTEVTQQHSLCWKKNLIYSLPQRSAQRTRSKHLSDKSALGRQQSTNQLHLLPAVLPVKWLKCTTVEIDRTYSRTVQISLEVQAFEKLNMVACNMDGYMHVTSLGEYQTMQTVIRFEWLIGFIAHRHVHFYVLSALCAVLNLQVPATWTPLTSILVSLMSK